MIHLIDDLPDNVLGFTAEGRVTAADYETVLMPAIEKRLETQSHLRFLYVLGKDFEGFDAGAMWEDTKVGLQHMRAWEAIAVVADAHLMRTLTKAFGFLMPCPVRAFPLEDEAEARRWISE